MSTPKSIADRNQKADMEEQKNSCHPLKPEKPAAKPAPVSDWDDSEIMNDFSSLGPDPNKKVKKESI